MPATQMNTVTRRGLDGRIQTGEAALVGEGQPVDPSKPAGASEQRSATVAQMQAVQLRQLTNSAIRETGKVRAPKRDDGEIDRETERVKAIARDLGLDWRDVTSWRFYEREVVVGDKHGRKHKVALP